MAFGKNEERKMDVILLSLFPVTPASIWTWIFYAASCDRVVLVKRDRFYAIANPVYYSLPTFMITDLKNRRGAEYTERGSKEIQVI